MLDDRLQPQDGVRLSRAHQHQHVVIEPRTCGRHSDVRHHESLEGTLRIL